MLVERPKLVPPLDSLLDLLPQFLGLVYPCITLHYIKIIVRKSKALQSLNKIELRVQKVKERKPRTNEILI